MTSRYLVVTGLPASGKSTLAKRLAPGLGLAVIDKDEILESLFEEVGVGDANWRRMLSQRADDEFRRRAEQTTGALLISWWRHPQSTVLSGTPTDWLSGLSGACVEVHCKCKPSVAAQRFAARQRHRGHLDGRWTVEELLSSFESQAMLGPLGLGHVVEVSTESHVDIDKLLREVAKVFSTLERQRAH